MLQRFLNFPRYVRAKGQTIEMNICFEAWYLHLLSLVDAWASTCLVSNSMKFSFINALCRVANIYGKVVSGAKVGDVIHLHRINFAV